MMQEIIHAEEIIIISEEKKKNSEKERGEKGGRVEKKMFSQQFICATQRTSYQGP